MPYGPKGYPPLERLVRFEPCPTTNANNSAAAAGHRTPIEGRLCHVMLPPSSANSQQQRSSQTNGKPSGTSRTYPQSVIFNADNNGQLKFSCCAGKLNDRRRVGLPSHLNVTRRPT